MAPWHPKAIASSILQDMEIGERSQVTLTDLGLSQISGLPEAETRLKLAVSPSESRSVGLKKWKVRLPLASHILIITLDIGRKSRTKMTCFWLQSPSNIILI